MRPGKLVSSTEKEEIEAGEEERWMTLAEVEEEEKEEEEEEESVAQMMKRLILFEIKKLCEE
ncbi:hypothetical protein E2C01_069046 [Portunus trituberculatus]|uniref:Uncharacterized protein n=1 Tax=Portunus trituberculatus TaxID=210409 RepID=A0A5B7I1S1_PORTR|nr:hypothetical protein [Portunus trituberculatus]